MPWITLCSEHLFFFFNIIEGIYSFTQNVSLVLIISTNVHIEISQICVSN